MQNFITWRALLESSSGERPFEAQDEQVTSGENGKNHNECLDCGVSQ